MPRSAWMYIGLVFGAGMLCVGLAFAPGAPALPPWSLMLFLLGCATLTQLFKVEAPTHQIYHATPVFMFAGVLLLPPAGLVPLVVVPHLLEWLKERASNGQHLRAWYLQPFNIAMYLVVTFVAHTLYHHLAQSLPLASPHWYLLTIAVTAVVYVIVNNLINGLALVFARGVSFRESGALNFATLGPELILLFLGAVTAHLTTDPAHLALIPLALSPLALMYKALMIPKLKEEAQIDAKTSLLNAHYLQKAFVAELERAERFRRPFAVLMADLDLLRDINNTYGHLAGDAVLGGIGKLIRTTIRDYDVAGRFGGEEFSIILPEADGAEAHKVAERLRTIIEAAAFPISTHPVPIRATMSIGIACYPQDGTTIKELTHAADIAVYHAKRLGRNQVVVANAVPTDIKLDHAAKALGGTSTGSPAPASRLAPTADTASGTTPTAASPLLAGGSSAAPQTTPTADHATIAAAAVPEPAAPARNHDKLPLLAWMYVVGVLLAASMAIVSALLSFQPTTDLWLPFLLLLLLAIISQVSKADGADHVLFHATPVFQFAGVMLLPPFLASMVVVVPHLVEWAKERWLKSRHLRTWYLQPFNIGKYLLAGAICHWLWTLLRGTWPAMTPTLQIVAGTLIGMAYVVVDRLLLSGALITARRVSWHDYHAHTKGLLTEYILVTLGLTTGLLWLVSPWALLLVVGPLVLIYRALSLPKLEIENLRKLHQINHELSQANHAVRQLNDELFLTLAKIFDARDPYVGGHAAQVALYAVAIAEELGLPREQVELVRQAAYLHDIGKMAIPESILHKPAKLTNEEYEIMKQHAALGAEFLQTSQGLRHLAPFVRHHHERWDGRGYPDRLSGVDIPLVARILNVCDSVEAMAADRPYHRGMSVDEIVAEVRRCAGSQFDPKIAQVFIAIAERKREQFVVNSAREVQRKQAVLDETSNFSSGLIFAKVYQLVE